MKSSRPEKSILGATPDRQATNAPKEDELRLPFWRESGRDWTLPRAGSKSIISVVMAGFLKCLGAIICALWIFFGVDLSLAVIAKDKKKNPRARGMIGDWGDMISL